MINNHNNNNDSSITNNNNDTNNNNCKLSAPFAVFFQLESDCAHKHVS